MIKIDQLTLYFGSQLILDRLTFALNPQDRVALVGENGAGKSSLFKIILGHIPADSGTVKRPDDLGYLPQETTFADESHTIHHTLSQSLGEVEQIQQKLHQLENEMATAGADIEALLAEYGEWQAQFEQKGGYEIEQKMEQVLHGLGLAHLEQNRPVSTLSGGEKRRLALAGLLLRQPHLLLLDEPTNHLDFSALAWLENYLRQYPHTLLLISHDRRFLNAVVNVIAELSPVTHQLTLYHGNYDFYRQERERLFAKQVAQYEEQTAEMKRLQQLIKQQAFARGGGRAPSDGDKLAYKARVENSEQTTSRTIRDAKQRLADLQEQVVARPTLRWSMNPHFEPLPLVSQQVIQFQNVSKSFDGRPLFTNLNKTITNGQRVVIVAPNGTGKTTLLKMILGEIRPDSGRVIVAPQAVVGYLDQEQNQLNPQRTVLAEYAQVAAGTENELRSALHRFALFKDDQVWQPVGTLSSGQKQKLQWAKIAALQANVLLLDEPTNHLDLPSLERLEELLQGFAGTLLIVSHDRWFIEAVATEVWEL